MIMMNSYIVATVKNSRKAGYDYLQENGYEFELEPREIKNKNRVYKNNRTNVTFELGKKDGNRWMAMPLDGSVCFMIGKTELENECEKIKL